MKNTIKFNKVNFKFASADLTNQPRVFIIEPDSIYIARNLLLTLSKNPKTITQQEIKLESESMKISTFSGITLQALSFIIFLS